MRKQGYYWVKTLTDKWEIAFWNESSTFSHWEVHWPNRDYPMDDLDFKEIDENQIIKM